MGIDSDGKPKKSPGANPKIHVDKDGTLWQLRVKDATRTPYYAEVEYVKIPVPENVTIEHYEQSRENHDNYIEKVERQAARTRQKNKSAGKSSKHRPSQPSNTMLHESIHICPMEITDNPKQAITHPAKLPNMLSWGQFHALYNSIASVSSWWPIADPRWDSHAYFQKLEKYIFYYEHMPVGFAALERNSGGHEGDTRIVFLGVIPQVHGKQFGSALLNLANEFAWMGGTQRIVLNTSPYDIMTRGGQSKKAAAEMYKKRGFVKIEEETVNATTALKDNKELYKLNLPGYYLNNPFYDKNYLFSRLCSEFVLSPEEGKDKIAGLDKIIRKQSETAGMEL